jgi:hypothetical protein
MHNFDNSSCVLGTAPLSAICQSMYPSSRLWGFRWGTQVFPTTRRVWGFYCPSLCFENASVPSDHPAFISSCALEWRRFEFPPRPPSTQIHDGQCRLSLLITEVFFKKNKNPKLQLQLLHWYHKMELGSRTCRCLSSIFANLLVGSL